jgi:hypothetical protein
MTKKDERKLFMICCGEIARSIVWARNAEEVEESIPYHKRGRFYIYEVPDLENGYIKNLD